jgi:NADH:ubiquinone oxidoreductase subunit F (NADH-binding)
MQAGLYGLPTLVQNVETLAHIPFILAQGPAAYRSLGVGQAGVTLCTFGTEFANSGVRLVPLGISVGDLVYKAGGGLRSGKALKAVQPGGPGSGFLTSLQFDTPFAYDELKRSGSAVGCAAIRGYSDDDDVVHAVAEVMKFFAENSCGKCPQCRMETQMLSRIANQTLAGAGNQKLFKQIPTIINANVGRGICGLIKMPVAPMMTGLERFRGEFDNYVVDGGGSLTSAT